MSADHDLEVRNLVKRFGSFAAVADVSFTIEKGSFFSILGPSGCGKTTLLRMIAGFAEPDSGEILIRGRPMLGVPPNRRPVNMIFQHLALFPMMTVAENIGYGLRRRRLPRAQIAERVTAMLERVGLPGAGDKRIDQLSGGQKQRVAIARSLVLDPELLLLDEPLGALDLKLREHMKVELKQLQAEVGTTFIYITHDQSEALVMSDTVAVMNAGRFEQVGRPDELYYDPKTAFVAGFVGDCNHWRGRIQRTDGGTAHVHTADGLDIRAMMSSGIETAAEVEVFVRPEAIHVSREMPDDARYANRIEGRIESVLFNGANSTALVKDTLSGDTVLVALPQAGHFTSLGRGDPIYLAWEAAHTRCYPRAESLASVEEVV